MIRQSSHRRGAARVGVACALGVPVTVALWMVCAFAQYQVNNRVNTGVNTGGMGPINTRVGGELYGNNVSTGTVRYAPQVSYLPSEVRYAEMRSGALPSELRMNAAAVGKLAPEGAVAYIPAQSEWQKAVKAPGPALWGPAYGKRPEAPSPAGPAAPTPLAQANLGSVRHAQSSVNSAYFVVPEMTSGGPINATPVNTAVAVAPLSAQQPINNRVEALLPPATVTLPPGSIRYSRPTTQPAPPSLAP